MSTPAPLTCLEEESVLPVLIAPRWPSTTPKALRNPLARPALTACPCPRCLSPRLHPSPVRPLARNLLPGMMTRDCPRACCYTVLPG
jgi:hypothetical protein